MIARLYIMGSYDHMIWSFDLRSHFGSSPFICCTTAVPSYHPLQTGVWDVQRFWACFNYGFLLFSRRPSFRRVRRVDVFNKIKDDPGSIQLLHPSLRLVLRSHIIDIFVNGRLERKGEAESKGWIRVAPRRCARSSMQKGGRY